MVWLLLTAELRCAERDGGTDEHVGGVTQSLSLHPSFMHTRLTAQSAATCVLLEEHWMPPFCPVLSALPAGFPEWQSLPAALCVPGGHSLCCSHWHRLEFVPIDHPPLQNLLLPQSPVPVLPVSISSDVCVWILMLPQCSGCCSGDTKLGCREALGDMITELFRALFPPVTFLLGSRLIFPTQPYFRFNTSINYSS